MPTNEELALQIRGGNGEVISQLWDQCKGYIWKQAMRWKAAYSHRPDFDVEDLTQCGYFALCDAVAAFDPERGTFITMLSYTLKTQFSAAIGCRTEAQTKEPLFSAVRLDTPVGEDGSITYGDMIPVEEEGYEKVEESLYRANVAEVVKDALSALPARQKEAVHGYYLDGKSYRAMACDMCISAARCQQLVADGLKKLRKGSHSATMAALLWDEFNPYKGTGYGAFKGSGCSVQEKAVEWKEKQEERYRLNRHREYKIQYCIERLGMDRAEAEFLFPA